MAKSSNVKVMPATLAEMLDDGPVSSVDKDTTSDKGAFKRNIYVANVLTDLVDTVISKRQLETLIALCNARAYPNQSTASCEMWAARKVASLVKSKILTVV